VHVAEPHNIVYVKTKYFEHVVVSRNFQTRRNTSEMYTRVRPREWKNSTYEFTYRVYKTCTHNNNYDRSVEGIPLNLHVSSRKFARKSILLITRLRLEAAFQDLKLVFSNGDFKQPVDRTRAPTHVSNTRNNNNIAHNYFRSFFKVTKTRV